MSWTFTFPKTFREWIYPLTLVAHTGGDVQLVPPAWSLELELFYYVIIGFIFYRWFLPTLAFAILAMLFSCLAAVHIINIPFYLNYLTSGFLFLLGSSAFHFAKRYDFPRSVPILAMAAILINSYISINYLPIGAQRDLSLIVCGVLFTVFLMSSSRIKISGALTPIAAAAGSLSYPVFLYHMAIAAALMGVFPSWRLGSTAYLCAVYASTIVVALASIRLIDRPIERLRSRLRRGNRAIVATSSVPVRTAWVWVQKATPRVVVGAELLNVVPFLLSLDLGANFRRHDWVFKGADLPSVVGHVDGTARSAQCGSEGPGVVTFGPYIDLQRGTYHVRIRYSSHGPIDQEIGRWDIYDGTDAVSRSTYVLYGTVGSETTAEATFVVRSWLPHRFEFRNIWNGVSDIRIINVELNRT
jgi:hypothetical protein